MDAQEYLDRCGVTAYMKDVVTLLLENRPAHPIAFISRYFKTVTQGSSPLLRAYRYIQLAPPTQTTAFVDNLVAAYVALDSRRGTSHVTGAELVRLLRLLAGHCPVDISAPLLQQLGRAESDPISFGEFSALVRASLQYEAFFSRASTLFSSCDPHGTGHVPRSILQLVLRQLGTDTDAAGVAAALTRERARDAKGDDGGVQASTAVADLPPVAARAELHRLQREIQNEVARLGTEHSACSPSRDGGEAGSIGYNEFVKLLLQASAAR